MNLAVAARRPACRRSLMVTQFGVTTQAESAPVYFEQIQITAGMRHMAVEASIAHITGAAEVLVDERANGIGVTLAADILQHLGGEKVIRFAMWIVTYHAALVIPQRMPAASSDELRLDGSVAGITKILRLLILELERIFPGMHIVAARAPEIGFLMVAFHPGVLINFRIVAIKAGDQILLIGLVIGEQVYASLARLIA